MANKTMYSAEQKKEVVELYLAGKKLHEIAELTGVKHGSVSHILKSRDVPLRCPNKQHHAKKVCPNCKKSLDPGANYCMHCGTDVRSERQLLLAKCERIMIRVHLLPESAKDEVITSMISIMNYLKKE